MAQMKCSRHRYNRNRQKCSIACDFGGPVSSHSLRGSLKSRQQADILINMERKRQDSLKGRGGVAAGEVMGNKKGSAAAPACADKALGSRADSERTLLQTAHGVPEGRLPAREPSL